MTLKAIFTGIGDFMQWTFNVLEADAVGNKLNYTLLFLGFFGFFFWMRKQAQFNAKAESDSNQLK